jgi:ElaB/YqjD/DUF883 family membrane-anchored ribosome-binding protein
MVKPRKSAGKGRRAKSSKKRKRTQSVRRIIKRQPVRLLTEKKIAELDRSNELNPKINALLEEHRFVADRKQVEAVEKNLNAIAKYIEEHPKCMLGISTAASIYTRMGKFFEAGQMYERNAHEQVFYLQFAAQEYLRTSEYWEHAKRVAKKMEELFLDEKKALGESDTRLLKWAHWVYYRLEDKHNSLRLEKLMKKHKIR